ncbi:hypothetical protein V5O48_017190 [Marasmius crinis-equi]|uniref:Extracellular membrane protein CFEM domain-containing protein n=1 Tax=Marasmius crinis-equi TaxID=585013 RepID=A0ABR3EPN5_9AGAR
MFYSTVASLVLLTIALPSLVYGGLLARDAVPNTEIFNNSSLATLTAIGTFDSDRIPAACEGPCNANPGNCQSDDDISCICTNDFSAALAKCANCVITKDTSVTRQDAQAFVDAFAKGCSDSGFSVKSATVNGAVSKMTIEVGVLAGSAVVLSTMLML